MGKKGRNGAWVRGEEGGLSCVDAMRAMRAFGSRLARLSSQESIGWAPGDEMREGGVTRMPCWAVPCRAVPCRAACCLLPAACLRPSVPLAAPNADWPCAT